MGTHKWRAPTTTAPFGDRKSGHPFLARSQQVDDIAVIVVVVVVVAIVATGTARLPYDEYLASVIRKIPMKVVVP